MINTLLHDSSSKSETSIDSEYDIHYFCNEENSGKIFAKIGKSSPEISAKGGYYNFSEAIGKIANSNNADGFTLERLEDTINCFHYGDQLVIFSFNKLADNIKGHRFWAEDNYTYNGCYQVNPVYVEAVMSLGELSTIDYIFDNIDNSYLKKYENTSVAIGCLKRYGFNESAEYFLKKITSLRAEKPQLNEMQSRTSYQEQNKPKNWFQRILSIFKSK
ncbi:MAG: hypothetical protein ACI4KA_04460 [Oscillospiraceae bacterium]